MTAQFSGRGYHDAMKTVELVKAILAGLRGGRKMGTNELIKGQIEECIVALRQGELTEGDLRMVVDGMDDVKLQRQDLLYMQTSTTGLDTEAHGMTMIVDGEVVEPASPDDWPYNSPLEAIRDGWRIIEFPNLALLMDESKTYGLGCEFILERLR